MPHWYGNQELLLKNTTTEKTKCRALSSSTDTPLCQKAPREHSSQTEPVEDLDPKLGNFKSCLCDAPCLNTNYVRREGWQATAADDLHMQDLSQTTETPAHRLHARRMLGVFGQLLHGTKVRSRRFEALSPRMRRALPMLASFR